MKRLIGIGTASLAIIIFPGRSMNAAEGVPAGQIAAASGGISLAAAQACEEKMQVLSYGPSVPQKSFQPIVVTEVEANSYLIYRSQRYLPPGVYGPRIQINSDHLSGTADVDFNQLNQATAKSDDWQTKLLAWMFRGRQKVSATGKLETRNGQAKVTITSVTVGTMELPNWLVDWVLETYVQPRYNIDLSKPIVLPDHVTHIALGSSQATFYRSPNKQ